MELIGPTLFVTVAELVELGVRENTVETGITRSRRAKSASWQTDKINGIKHVKYCSIPPLTRVNLPDEVTLWATFKAKQSQQTTQTGVLVAAEQLALAVEKGWQAHKQPFLLALGMNDEGHAAAEQVARLQAALEWCLKEGRAYDLRREILPAFQSLRLVFCPQQGARGGDGAYSSLHRKLSQYRAALDKPAYLLAKRGAPRGNRNRAKLEAAQRAWLLKHFKQAEKPTIEQTQLAYLAYREATRTDWPLLSVRTVGNMLKNSQPEWFLSRHGEAATKKAMGYRIQKQRPSAPDVLLEFDGTNDPLLFVDEHGREVSKLYSVRVWDMHSDCIVGSAYGFTETSDLVLAALQDYLLTWRRMPQQFRYDKGAANMSKVVQALLAATGAQFYFPSEAGRPTGRRSEQLTGQFQKVVQRKMGHYRGPNITSNNNLDLQANPERLKAALAVPTSVAAMIAECKACEREWNERRPGPRSPERRSPLERYTASSGPVLPLERLAELLFVRRERTVRYSANGLKLEVAGQDFTFEPQLANGTPDQPAHHAACGHAFDVWEMKDGSRAQVLVRRADGNGPWLEMRRKYAYSESLVEMQPGDVQRLHATLATSRATIAAMREPEPVELEPVEMGQADLGHTRLGKTDWNRANAAAERERLQLGTVRPVAPATLPISGGSQWFMQQHLQQSTPDKKPPGYLEDVD